jgi:uncharacterized protein (TIGR02145 family)
MIKKMKRVICILILVVVVIAGGYFIFFDKGGIVKKNKTGTEGSVVRDIDGNIYNTVAIGNQLWLNEDLKTTRLNDSTEIININDVKIWSERVGPAYCWYNNTSKSNSEAYGALYNWYAVETKKLCPTGWHVPDNNDWNILVRFLGGDSNAGQKLKEEGKTLWISGNKATNESGFGAVPSGYRFVDGVFYDKGLNETWWTSTETSGLSAMARLISYASNSVYQIPYYNKKHGFSIRCIKNTFTLLKDSVKNTADQINSNN